MDFRIGRVAELLGHYRIVVGAQHFLGPRDGAAGALLKRLGPPPPTRAVAPRLGLTV